MGKDYKKEDKFVEQMLKSVPNANKEVLTFIADFLCHNGSNEEQQEDIRKLFHSGYCFYFANMLKTAFDRGEVVWCAPFGHIAWQDVDGQVYDVEGVSCTEAEYFIPISYLGDAVKDFMHVRNVSFNASVEDIQGIIDAYLVDQGKESLKKDKKSLDLQVKDAAGKRGELKQSGKAVCFRSRRISERLIM